MQSGAFYLHFFSSENTIRNFYYYFQQVILQKKINYGNKYQFCDLREFSRQRKAFQSCGDGF
jgi:hypothetical protein